MLARAEQAAGTRHGWFDTEIANLRAALAWFRDSGSWAACARLARAMAPWWLLRSHHGEGLRWLETILGHIDVSGETADLLCEAGLLAFRLGRIAEAETWGSRALELAEAAGDRPATARALMVLANIHDRANDHAEAHPRFTAALAIQRELGDPVAIADTLVSLACIHLDKAEYDDAASLLDEAISLTDPVDSTFMHARAIDISGIVLYLRRQPGPALDRYDRALGLYRQCGSVRGQALTLDHAGKALSAAGDVPAAWERHRQALPLRQAVGDPRGICVWLEAVAYALLAADRPGMTFSILACTASQRDAGGFLWNGHERIEVGWAREAIASQLPRASADRAWASGSLWSLDEAIAQAVTAMEAAVRAWRPADDTLFARYGLTPREADVMACLRRRLTDKQIADELCISPRTASTHVAAILGKLGLRSRRDIPTAL
jgi:DNA-binding CsgD family transcriptional regulator/tetratricopeptide (TPR) repeat protein